MWSYLFPPSRPVETRFKKRMETKKIIEFLTELKNKEGEFKKNSDNLGTGSIDYAKYIVLSHLNKNLDMAIDEYNQKSIPTDEVKDIQEFLDLLRQFGEYLAMMITNYSDSLNKHRYSAPISSTGIKIALAGTAGVAFLMYGFVAGLACLCFQDAASLVVRTGTNLFNDHPSATQKLLIDFSAHLKDTIKNLILVINLKQLKTDSVMISNEDNMTCPITADLMDDPYLCLLDGYSYEKYAIVKCLTDSRKSPMTRRAMAPDAKVEDVIIENRALKNIIANYRIYQQQFTENKLPENKLH